MVTMKEIAERLGVSIKTVSRVINDEKYVNEETRKMVLKEIQKLGYKPNQLARSLTTNKTYSIGLLVSNIANPFFSEVVKGIGQTAQDKGYSLIITEAETYEDAIKNIDVLLEKRVDGIIIYTMGFKSSSHKQHDELIIKFMDYIRDLAEDMRKKDVYFSLINWQLKDSTINSVCGDNKRGSSELTEYLIKQGHRKIGYITEKVSISANSDFDKIDPWDVWNSRFIGFIETLKRNNIKINEQYILTETESFEGGYRAMLKYIEMKDRPTAIYAANDILALGAIYAINERGLKIPDDFSIIGFDGIDIGNMIYPKLTTMSHDRYKIGSLAVNFLINNINDPSLINNTILSPKLTIGQSVGVLKK